MITNQHAISRAQVITIPEEVTTEKFLKMYMIREYPIRTDEDVLSTVKPNLSRAYIVLLRHVLRCLN